MLIYILYYLAIPMLIIYVSWKLRDEKSYLLEVKKNLNYLEKNKDDLKEEYLKFYLPKYKRYLTKSIDKIKKLQIAAVVALLILLPLWHFSIATAAHNQAHIEIVGGGISPGRIDPVIWEIEPTYDTDHALNKIYEKNKTFRPDLLNRVVDLEELTDIPGKIAVYRFRGTGYGKILLTYTYISPVPVVKAVGIQWFDGSDALYVKNVETFVFPRGPIAIANTADL